MCFIRISLYAYQASEKLLCCETPRLDWGIMMWGKQGMVSPNHTLICKVLLYIVLLRFAAVLPGLRYWTVRRMHN